MQFNIEVRSIWEIGQRKDAEGNPHQEDNIFPTFGNQSEQDRLFILCDGMGGHDKGEVASLTVCQAMSESILSKDSCAFSEVELNDAINNAYSALDEKDNGAENKMGTTMTLLKLFDKGALIAHIGDSRVYHIRPGETGDTTKILFVTQDHSLVNDLVKIGELTPQEAKHSKQKNIITRAMQPCTRRCKADVYKTDDIKAGDYFYLCSDGMLEQMEDDAIKNIFSESGGDIDKKQKILVGATKENKDNHSAILVHIKNTDTVKSDEQKSCGRFGCVLAQYYKHIHHKLKRISKTIAITIHKIVNSIKSKRIEQFLPSQKPNSNTSYTPKDGSMKDTNTKPQK
jgi:protein phosphatase